MTEREYLEGLLPEDEERFYRLIDCDWCGDETEDARRLGDETVCESCYTEGYVRDQV